MATAIEGRASVDFAGDEWIIAQCLEETGDKIICRLRSKNRSTYTEGDVGSVAVETVEALDRDLVVKASLESAALRSGVTGVLLFNKFYPIPGR